jgi:hypothetical protein
MEEDIPVPFGVPAATLKYSPCRVSRLQAVNDCFQAQGITFRANRECRVSTLNGPSITLVDHRVGWEADIRTRQRMRRAHRALDSATEGVVVMNFPDHRN